MTVTDYKLYIVNPSAATNLCTNPSFETGTTGWTTGGTNTIATSAVQQRRGVYSCKCTYTDNDLLASYAITLTDTDHVASMDIYIPSTYTGTQLTLTWTGFTSGTVVAGLADMTIKDHWQRVHCHINPDAGDLAGTLTLSETGTNGSAGEFIYIDGVQIETGTAETTYFDGDSEGFLDNVLEYYWSGQQNASTSVRTANTRSGGSLVDIESYCKIIMTDGLGIAPVDNVAIALTKGGERFLYSNLTARYFNVRVVFKGTEIGTIQSNRKAFVNLIKPDKTAYNQPLVIRYQGIDDNGNQESDPVNIVCQYVSGLDQSPVMKFAHFADLTFRLSGTALEVDGDAGVGLDYNDTLTTAYIAKRSPEGVWSAMAGVTGTVRAIAQHPITKEIYIGGAGLNNGGDADADYLAKWNGNAWVSVVAGCNNTVRDLIFDTSGNLYITGEFTNFGDADGNNIVKWDGSALSSLGTGLSDDGYKLLFDASGNLYVGGAFTSAGGVANTARIAMWNGTTWVTVGGGISSGVVYSLALDNSNSNLYIGGTFTDHGDTNGDYITVYNISSGTYSSLSTGLNEQCNDIVINSSDDVYICGAFTSAGGISTNYLAKWNGKKFDTLGSNTNEKVNRILIKDNNFYIGGYFTSAGEVSLLDRIAIYLGNGIYQPLDINLPGSPVVFKLFIDNLNNFYVGFTTSGNAETAGDDIITNGGTAVTYPVITVTGPGLLRQIANTTTGKAIYFNNLTLQAGEVITMDLRPDKLTMVSTFRGNIKSYLLKGSNLDFPLVPGSNRIATFIDGTTTSATAATMKWKPMLHGLDGAQYE